jgi:hypothetical protein
MEYNLIKFYSTLLNIDIVLIEFSNITIFKNNEPNDFLFLLKIDGYYFNIITYSNFLKISNYELRIIIVNKLLKNKNKINFR